MSIRPRGLVHRILLKDYIPISLSLSVDAYGMDFLKRDRHSSRATASVKTALPFRSGKASSSESEALTRSCDPLSPLVSVGLPN